MKKIEKKKSVLKKVGCASMIVGLILAIITAVVKNEKASLIMAIIGCILIGVGLFIVALQSEKNRTAKMLGIFALMAFVFTWILPYGYFQGAEFLSYGMNRIGLADLGLVSYYAVYFSIDKLVFLLAVAGFYGVLSVTSGYQELVTTLGKKLQGKEIVTSVIISLLIMLEVAMTSQTLIALVFIPFFVSVLANMKLDKLTTFVVTFGSALVAMIGTIYGTESLSFFNSYLGTSIDVGLSYRAIILSVAFILYNFFIVMRVKSVLAAVKPKRGRRTKEKNTEEAEMVDPFVVEKSKKKAAIIPCAIILLIVAVMTILGYVAWANWKITAFSEFHTWLTKTLKIGETPIFGIILGSKAVEFGKFELITIIPVLLVASILLAIMYKVNVSEYFDGLYSGVKKAIKPLLAAFAIYTIFVICYMSPFIPTFANWAFGLTKTLNPLISMIVAFVSSMFHTDLGYIGYIVGPYLTASYAGNLALIHTIFVSMYGLVQLLMPTSILLMVGLFLMDLDYKTWFKYIWMFAVGMVIILLVLFIVLL